MFEAIEEQKAALENELRSALKKFETSYRVPADFAFKRLTDIPNSLLWPMPTISKRTMEVIVDDDAKAALLRTNQGRWGEIENATWTNLTKAEKRASRKLTGFLGQGRPFPRQRPTQSYPALTLFLIFTIEELLGKRFPFSRLPSGGSAKGPAFKTLVAAQNLAQWRIAVRAGSPPKTARIS